LNQELRERPGIDGEESRESNPWLISESICCSDQFAFWARTLIPVDGCLARNFSRPTRIQDSGSPHAGAIFLRSEPQKSAIYLLSDELRRGKAVAA
jgi:hypothetical protein